LLMNPLDRPLEGASTSQPTPSRPSAASPLRDAGFHNEPPLDFAVPESRQRMLSALAEVESQLGRYYPLEIEGCPVDTNERLASINPSHKRQVVGTAGAASEWHARAAVSAAREAWPTWAARPVEER